jgi:hypothetical protein
MVRKQKMSVTAEQIEQQLVEAVEAADGLRAAALGRAARLQVAKARGAVMEAARQQAVYGEGAEPAVAAAAHAERLARTALGFRREAARAGVRPATAAPGTAIVHGLVLDSHGRPVPGLDIDAIVRRRRLARTPTDTTGYFRLEITLADSAVAEEEESPRAEALFEEQSDAYTTKAFAAPGKEGRLALTLVVRKGSRELWRSKEPIQLESESEEYLEIELVEG